MLKEGSLFVWGIPAGTLRKRTASRMRRHFTLDPYRYLRYVLHYPTHRTLSLPAVYQLIHKNCSRDARVERLRAALHGQAKQMGRVRPRLRADAGTFVAHH